MRWLAVHISTSARVSAAPSFWNLCSLLYGQRRASAVCFAVDRIGRAVCINMYTPLTSSSPISSDAGLKPQGYGTSGQSITYLHQQDLGMNGTRLRRRDNT